MPTDIDPDHVEPRMLLQAAAFAGARVLEIGSGDGRLAFRYANASAFVVGIEQDAQALASAIAGCPPGLRRRLRFARANAAALPFREETFDIAVLAWSL
jgi:ubiquinone/menaquinone biosynthesis C-methylase UbiE